MTRHSSGRARHPGARWAVAAATMVLVSLGAATAGAGTPAFDGGGHAAAWPMGGQNVLDTHSNPLEHAISPGNVGSLAPAWTYTTAGDVSATPAVVGGVVYFPDWGGYLNAVDAATGARIWRRPISAYDGIPGAVSRTSPAVVGGVVYIGDQNGAHLMAVDARTGGLLWATQLSTNQAAILTASPIVYHGVVFEGVSSDEESLASDPSYHCCTFRGSMTAVDAATGHLRWKTFMLPPNGGVPGGYSGAAVWSSTPALDPATGTLYITTGNDYTVPASVTACQDTGGTPAQCLSPDDHGDAIVALDAATGRTEWADSQGGFDAYTNACLNGSGPNCPGNPGADADFGNGPQLLTIRGPDGRPETVVGAGEKSGVYWLADAATGKVLWGTQVGPGSSLGGMEWGSATDGRRIYVAEADFFHLPYWPAGSWWPIFWGSWAALDPQTGKILWQTPDPSFGVDAGAVTVADGVVYAGSSSGGMYALDAATGRILWHYQAEGTSIAAPAVVGGTVFWGDGYSRLPYFGTGSTRFYAFRPTRPPGPGTGTTAGDWWGWANPRSAPAG